MLETKLKNPRDHKIAELERELVLYQAFTISHMLANDLQRLVTYSPAKYMDIHKDKAVLVLKREEIDNETTLVAELSIKQGKEH